MSDAPNDILAGSAAKPVKPSTPDLKLVKPNGAASGADCGPSPAPKAQRKLISDLFEMPTVRGYLNRIGAEAINLTTAYVNERDEASRYVFHRTRIKFDKDGTVTVTPADDPSLAPTDMEQAGIKEDFASVELPEFSPLVRRASPPKELASAKDANFIGNYKFGEENGRKVMILPAEGSYLFEFLDPTGKLTLMLQHTVYKNAVDKVPSNWTHWSDGKWRKAEPDKLPLYGLEQLKHASTVFLHEGPKAAALVRELTRATSDPLTTAALKDHPWGKELTAAAHLGWAGGALNSHRTDWTPLGPVVN